VNETKTETAHAGTLLRAVVQVMFDFTALLDACLDDPGAGGTDLFQLGGQRGLQPPVLQREPGSRDASIEHGRWLRSSLSRTSTASGAPSA
jgi:hypothetical protein